MTKKHTIVTFTSILAVVVSACLIASCRTAPRSAEDRVALQRQAQITLQSMQAKLPSLQQTLDDAAGYVVFPRIGKGGAIVGGAHGRGIVYERGVQIGYADLNQASIGAQLGGQTFSELIIFKDQDQLNALRSGNWNLSSDVSVVVLEAGAAAGIVFRRGVAVVIEPTGGLMVEFSVAGQRLGFEPST